VRQHVVNMMIGYTASSIIPIMVDFYTAFLLGSACANMTNLDSCGGSCGRFTIHSHLLIHCCRSCSAKASTCRSLLRSHDIVMLHTNTEQLRSALLPLMVRFHSDCLGDRSTQWYVLTVISFNINIC
jgi:hypothetical protein